MLTEIIGYGIKLSEEIELNEYQGECYIEVSREGTRNWYDNGCAHRIALPGIKTVMQLKDFCRAFGKEI